MSDFNDAVEGIDEGVAVARTWQTETGASPRPSMVPGHDRGQNQTEAASHRP